MVNIGFRTIGQCLSIASFSALALSTPLVAQRAQHYKQTNLVADLPGVAAATDPNLVNPWGMSRSSGSPWWVSDNGPGLATLYSGAGATVPLVVTIPPADSSGGQTGTPSGQAFNGTSDFNLAPGKPALFIFVTEDGTISGWNPGVAAKSAVVMVNTNGDSVFKGIALAEMRTSATSRANMLYVADFRKGQVAVYDSSFHWVSLPDGAFKDEHLPSGYAPFNVQNIGGNLYVAFAMPDSAKHDEIDGAGLGYVDVFSPSGQLLNRLEHGSWFNAPWGIAQAPSDFGRYSHDILVGQFGSGQIVVFDPVTGAFKGTLNDAKNVPIAIDGLWDIAFGSDGSSGPATTLYFTAGPDGEQHGLFGTITAIDNLLGGDI